MRAFVAWFNESNSLHVTQYTSYLICLSNSGDELL